MAAAIDIVREASELFGSLEQQMQLVGGMWPERVTVEGREFGRAEAERDAEGELVAVLYGARDGSTLTVLND